MKNQIIYAVEKDRSFMVKIDRTYMTNYVDGDFKLARFETKEEAEKAIRSYRELWS